MGMMTIGHIITAATHNNWWLFTPPEGRLPTYYLGFYAPYVVWLPMVVLGVIGLRKLK